MPKIQDVGVGNYIRNPKGRHGADSRQTNVEVLKVSRSEGNGFLCYPVVDAAAVPPTLDTTRYQIIPIDTVVKQVTI